MSTQIKIHSTAVVAAKVLIGAVCVISLALFVNRIKSPLQSNSSSAVLLQNEPISGELLLFPIIKCAANASSPEKEWSDSLSNQIGGQREYPVPNGRVDVVTNGYAIEVDRLDKWHEAIGQALHYGTATSKLPAIALILNNNDLAKRESLNAILSTIKITCAKSGIDIILLIEKE